MAAALHQVEVIELFHRAGRGGERLDHGAVGVVDQQHDVRQLDRRAAAHAGAGWDAVENRPLGRADERAGAGGEVVCVKVDHADQTVADAAVGLLTLDIEQGLRQQGKDVVGEVFVHRAVDACDIFVHVGILQLRLRQDQAQGGRGVADLLLHGLPVFRLRGELVTGHDGPLCHILSLGQQDIRRIKAELFKLLVHGCSSSVSKKIRWLW